MAIESTCSELAAHFLPEDAPEADKKFLTQYIQDAIDEWLDDNGYGPDKDPDEDSKDE